MRRLLLAVAILLLPLGVEAGDSRAQILLARQASVTLYTIDQGERDDFCSGVVVGHRAIQTAWHCLHGNNSLSRTYVQSYNGKTAKGLSVLKENRGWDMAIFSIDRPLPGTRIPLLNQDVQPGDQVLILGSMDGQPFTASRLLISSILEDGFFKGTAGYEEHQLLQAVGPVWHGLSGSGVFDEEGRLIGIMTRMRKIDNSDYALWAWVVGPRTIAEFWGVK